MRGQARKFFFRLENIENFITYLLALPLALYIAVICGDVRGEKLTALIYGILIFIPPLSISSFIINHRRMVKFLPVLFDENASGENLERAYTKALKEPMIQALSISIRWVIAPSGSLLLANIFTPMEALQYYAIGIVVLVIVPPSFIYSYFIAERELARILDSPRLTVLNHKTTLQFSLRKKIGASLFAMGLSPAAALGFIILETNLNLVHFERIGLHTIIIIILLFMNLFYISRVFSSSVRRTMDLTHSGISRIAEGNLTAYIPIITRDEMGSMNNHLNNLIAVLNGIISGIDGEAKNLNMDSGSLADTIGKLSDNAQDVASSVEEMSASIEELAASSESIADNSKEQNQQTGIVSSLMEKILQNAETISQRASSGAEISKVAEEKAGEGEIILNETISKIENIQRSTQSINDSASIIKDIADQVNLLSLNASIEAARAGEYGKGFSVVAEEISKLADNTQQNADQITKSISLTLADVNNGIASIKITSEKFNEIISFVKKTAAMVMEIAREARSQSDISDEIQKHFLDMMSMTESNLRATEEQATTHQEFIDTVSRISEAIQDIANRATAVNELSQTLDGRADKLTGEIEFFSL